MIQFLTSLPGEETPVVFQLKELIRLEVQTTHPTGEHQLTHRRELQIFKILLLQNPTILPSDHLQLIHCFHHNQSKIIVPTCNGHRGHPVMIGSQYFGEVLLSHTRAGLRGFLDTHQKEIAEVAVSDSAAMEDMDTPADYRRKKKLFANRYADTVSPA